jgi:hypothetical protein
MADTPLTHWAAAIVSAFGIGVLIGKLTSFDSELRKTITEGKVLQQAKDSQESKASFYLVWHRRLAHSWVVSAIVAGTSAALYVAKPETRDVSGKVALVSANLGVFSFLGSRLAKKRHDYHKQELQETEKALKSNRSALTQVVGDNAVHAVS